MTSDNNNWMTDFKRGKNGKIVFEKRMLFAGMKNEQGACFAPFKNKICFWCWPPVSCHQQPNVERTFHYYKSNFKSSADVGVIVTSTKALPKLIQPLKVVMHMDFYVVHPLYRLRIKLWYASYKMWHQTSISILITLTSPTTSDDTKSRVDISKKTRPVQQLFKDSWTNGALNTQTELM